MITTTLGILMTAEPALGRLAEQRLAPRHSYGLAKLVEAVRAETARFTAERQKLAEQFGTAREATAEERATLGARVITVPPEHMAPFAAGVSELAAIPVTLPAPPFDLAWCNGDAITARDILDLGPLVTFTPEEAPHG